MFCETPQSGASAVPCSLPMMSNGGTLMRHESIQMATMKDSVRRVVALTPYVSGRVMAK